MRLNSFMSLGATLLLAAAVGCAGDLTPMPGTGDGTGGGDGDGNGDGTGGGDGDGEARAIFDGLHEQLMLECQACHLGVNDEASIANGPDVLGADPSPDAVYDSLMNGTSIVDGAPIIADSPADSKLYFYGSVPHTGSVGMSADLATQVEDWIIAEASANGGPPEDEEPGDEEEPGEEEPVGPTDRFQALQMFASCMSYDDFAATTFDEISEIATDQGACSKCHGTGNFGAYISDNDIDFYLGQRSLDANGELVATSIFAFATALSDGQGGYIIEQTQRYAKKGVGIGVSNHPNYLFYDGNGNDLDDQVDLFFNATLQRYEQAIATGVPCTPDNPQQ